MTCAALARLFRHITSIGTEPGVEAEVTTADAQVQLFSKLIPVVKEREGRQASRQAEREREREKKGKVRERGKREGERQLKLYCIVIDWCFQCVYGVNTNKQLGEFYYHFLI